MNLTALRRRLSSTCPSRGRVADADVGHVRADGPELDALRDGASAQHVADLLDDLAQVERRPLQSSPPASILEKSRMSLMTPAGTPPTRDLGELRAARSSASCSSSSSVMPITPFIGVRISWLMVARKSDLARCPLGAVARVGQLPRDSLSIRDPGEQDRGVLDHLLDHVVPVQRRQ